MLNSSAILLHMQKRVDTHLRLVVTNTQDANTFISIIIKQKRNDQQQQQLSLNIGPDRFFHRCRRRLRFLATLHNILRRFFFAPLQFALQISAGRQFTNLAFINGTRQRRGSVFRRQTTKNTHGLTRTLVHVLAGTAFATLLVDALVSKTKFAVFSARLATFRANLAKTKGFGQARGSKDFFVTTRLLVRRRCDSVTVHSWRRRRRR